MTAVSMLIEPSNNATERGFIERFLAFSNESMKNSIRAYGYVGPHHCMIGQIVRSNVMNVFCVGDTFTQR
jgi:hypothetical protein